MASDPSSSASATLAQILRESALVWRGNESPSLTTMSTGFAELDDCMPGGGWPVGTLIEIIPACEGVGELSLCLPVLVALCRDGRRIALVAPPHVPYAPALKRAGLSLQSVLWVGTDRDEDARWSAEQLLRDGTAGAVLVWSSTRDERLLRRLQLSAETGKSFAFLYRPTACLHQASPAALRIALDPDAEGTRAEVIKVRGGRPRSVTLNLAATFT
jgi:protein ImuA